MLFRDLSPSQEGASTHCGLPWQGCGKIDQPLARPGLPMTVVQPASHHASKWLKKTSDTREDQETQRTVSS